MKLNTILRIPLLIVALFATCAFAQQAQQPATVKTDPNDPTKQIIEVRVAAPELPKAATVISPYVRDAQDLGAAIGGGLKNLAQETKDMTFGKDKTLVQGIDELSHTDAGRFTMGVIAWKVAGQDALVLLRRFTGAAIGVPMLAVMLGIYIWVVRRFFILRMVKMEETVTGEGKEKVKTIKYGAVNADQHYSNATFPVIYSIDDATRYGGLFCASAVYLIVSAIVTFVVIL